MWPADKTFILSLQKGCLQFGVKQGNSWLEDAFFDMRIENDLQSLALGLESLLKWWHANQIAVATTKQRFRCPGLRIVLGCGWFDGVVLPWSPGLHRRSDLQSYANEFLLSSGVDVREGDAICVADAGYREQIWSVTYPGELLQVLGDFAGNLGAEIEYVAPIAAVLAQSHKALRKTQGILILNEGNALSAWRFDRGEVALLSDSLLTATGGMSAPISPVSFIDRLKLRERACFEQGIIYYFDMVSGGPLPDLDGRAECLPETEFLGQKEIASALLIAAVLEWAPSTSPIQHAGRLRMRHLYSAAFVLALVFVLSVKLVHVQGEMQDSIELLQSAMSQKAVRPIEVLSKEDVLRVQAVNVAIDELNLPVATLLRAIQPPKDIRVAVLGVAFSPERRASEGALLKLNAEARTGEEMVRYAAYIAERKPFYEAHLLHHEIAETDEVKPYRFRVEARWRN